MLFSILATNSAIFGKGLQFDELRLNFGTIAEDGGKIERVFTFRNSSSVPIVIQKVQTTCGCTTPEYSKAPIMPRENGTIRVTFDPMWRAGRNIRDIYVYTSAASDPIVLRLTGNVKARVVPIEERYPYKLSGAEDAVRIEATNFDFRALPRGELTQAVVGFVNPSKKAIKIEFRNSNGASLLKSFYSTSLAPGEEAVIELSYLLEEDSTLRGRLQDRLDIYIDGRLAQHALSVSGLIVEK
ncbi:MAG: DUF1573 domain-containing protein [Rikenellaceae bacterium]